MRRKEFNKEDLHTLRVWWTLAFESGETEIYNQCREYFDKRYGEYLEVKRCWKTHKKWEELKGRDLCYVPEHPLNTDGILEFYYKKDDLIRICGECKVIAKKVFKTMTGEKPEEAYKALLDLYYDYFVNEEDSKLNKSLLSKCAYRLLDEKRKKQVDEVMKKRNLIN
jgi:hypothetical protein